MAGRSIHVRLDDAAASALGQRGARFGVAPSRRSDGPFHRDHRSDVDARHGLLFRSTCPHIAGRATHVLVEQLAAVELGRLGERQGRLSGEEIQEVDDALRLVLALV